MLKRLLTKRQLTIIKAMDKNTSIEIQKHITQADLARLCEVTHPAVNQWMQGQRLVPARHCITIESATGGAVTVEMIRPDLNWQRDESGKPNGFTVRV